MQLPSPAALQMMPRSNAAALLEAHERDERDIYDDRSLWHRRGRAYARKLIREKLNRIEKLKMELGLI